jgi:hypothetical protein
LTEIYLCGVCSRQEILRRNGRGQDTESEESEDEETKQARLEAEGAHTETLGELKAKYKAAKKESEAKPESYKKRKRYVDALEAYRAAQMAGPAAGSTASMEVEEGGGGGGGGGGGCTIL